MRSQELIFGLASQVLYYDAPEGVPSLPSVQIFRSTDNDTGNQLSATTGSVTADTVSTTFSASAGAKSITVASGTGITRGRRYLLTDVDGDREWVEVISITSTTVGLRNPLINSYASSSTFKGCRISVTIDTTWASDASNISDVLDLAWLFTQRDPNPLPVGASGFRARWSYTVNGSTTIGVSFFDLVRYQAKNLVTPLDVDARFPGWIDRLATDNREDQGERLIAQALYALKLDLMVDNETLRRVRDVEVISELIIYRANLIAAEAAAMSNNNSPEVLQLAQKLYAARYDQLLREPKVPVDQGGAGALDQARRLPVFQR